MIKLLKKEKVFKQPILFIIGGDLNSRNGILLDEDRDLVIEKDNQKW